MEETDIFYICPPCTAILPISVLHWINTFDSTDEMLLTCLYQLSMDDNRTPAWCWILFALGHAF